MEQAILYAGMTLCLFSLWAIARHDWVRIGSPGRLVEARVSGHRTQRDDNGVSYAATYAFAAEGAEHEVTDQVYHRRPHPAEGERVMLSYPFGRPELAHVPRPLMWLAVYALLLTLFGVLLAKALGQLPG